eukprot:1158703-Pelagomonas_calceolata.AAC.4
MIGAGVYHPDSDSPNYVQPNGAGITNIIVRAELAAIAAAILQATLTLPLIAFLHSTRSESKHHIQSFTVSMSKAISLKYSYSSCAIHLPLFISTRLNLTLELRATNAQVPLPNTRLFRVMAPLQTKPSPVSTLMAIHSMTPPGLPLRKLPAPMQVHQKKMAQLTCPKL